MEHTPRWRRPSATSYEARPSHPRTPPRRCGAWSACTATTGASGNVDFSAWDMVRAAMLTRCGFALSWLTEDEVWDTLALLDRALRERYRNWTQVWESFWLTRWYWNSESGEGEHADDLHDLNRSLVLLGSDGPWGLVA